MILDKRVEEFLSKPFPENGHPRWLMVSTLFSDETCELLTRHWYKSFGIYYDQLQRSNYMNLDDYLWQYRNWSMPQFSDLEFLYAFNDYQLCHAQGVEIKDVFDGPVPFFENLGANYWNGDGVEKDDSESAFWYELAAQSGDPQAMFCIGWFTVNGIGVKQDLSAGMTWIRKAAWRGYVPAKDYLEEKRKAASK